MIRKIKSLRGVLYKKIKKIEEEKQKVEKEVKLPGFEIRKVERLIELPEVKDPTKLNVTYPLIEPFAYANIRWDEREKTIMYNVIEPSLSEREKDLFKKISDALVELIEVKFTKAKDMKALIDYLKEKVLKILKDFGVKLSSTEFSKIMYYIYRDFAGYNELEPLLNDPNIEDISCDGAGIPFYIIHRKYGNLKTNVIINDVDRLRDLVIKLAERCGRYVSYAEPILAGTLPDGSRVSATLAGDVATRGPTFTIRKFGTKPFSPVDQIELKTADSEILAYLWYLIESKASILIVGGVATGKTSFLNSIAMFIEPEAKIVSIEDTRELKLVHEHWIPGLARVGFGIPTPTGEKYGEVSLFDLLRESFRQNPDYVVVGEVRGKETYVMFQGMASIPEWERVLVLNDGHWKLTEIGKLAKGKKYCAFSFNPLTKKFEISTIKNIVEHGERKIIYRIKTKAGREIWVTPDHSLFIFKDGIKPVATAQIKVGDKIVLPSKLPSGFNDLKELNLLELLPDIRVYAPKLIRRATKILGFEKASRIAGVKSISDFYAKFKRSKPSALKVSKFIKLMKKAKIQFKLKELKMRFDRRSKSLPAKLKITPEFLRLFGYWISEGSLGSGKGSQITLYNKDRKIIEDMKKCIRKVLKIDKIRERKIKGWGSSIELAFNHKVFYELLKRFCGKRSKERKIPFFIFGLSPKKIGEFLTGLYRGDGWLVKRGKNYVIGYSTSSPQLANDLLYLLLTLGIFARKKEKGKEISILIYSAEDQKRFARFVDFGNIKVRGNGRKRKFENIYLDEVEKIEKIVLKKPVKVFDLSTKNENFVGGFGGVLLHNSGHPCMSTFHAGSLDTVIKRLITPPITLPPSLLESLDVVVVMQHAKEKGKSARRIKEIVEIVGVDVKTDKILSNVVYRWDAIEDKYVKVNESVKIEKFALARGITKAEALKEIERRKRLLEWLKANGIKDYLEVVKWIREYYKRPKKVLERIGLTEERIEEIKKEEKIEKEKIPAKVEVKPGKVKKVKTLEEREKMRKKILRSLGFAILRE